MKRFLLYCLLFVSFITYSQSAILTPGVQGNIQIPKLSYEQINAIPNPKAGMMAFDSTFKCLKYYNGMEWLCASQSGSNAIGFAWQINYQYDNSFSQAGDIFVDDRGDIYIIGFYVTSGHGDTYIAKYTSTGNLIWETHPFTYNGGTYRSFSIAVDKFYNVYYTSQLYGYRGSPFIETGKINFNGTLNWSKQIGNSPSTTIPFSNKVFLDDSQNIYVSGVFNGELYAGTTITSSVLNERFIVKLNNNGDYQWVKKCNATIVSVDRNGNSYFAGQFSNSTTIEGTTLNSVGQEDILFGKFDTNGSLSWIKRAGGVGADKASDIKINDVGDLYFTGSFSSNAWFDTTPVNAIDGEDFYAAKYRSDGMFMWVRNGGGIGVDKGSQVEITPDNDIVAIGSTTSSTASFYPGSTLNHASGYRGFLVKYDGENGDLVWISSIPGISNIKINSTGSTYIWSQNSFAKYSPNGVFIYQQNFGGIGKGCTTWSSNHILFIGEFTGIERIGSSILTKEIGVGIYISHWME